MKQKLRVFLTLLLCAVASVGWSQETTVTDVLTWSDLVPTSGSSYTNFSDKTFNSDAVYAGQISNGSGKYIQLRKQSPAGIVTTASGGKIKSVTIEWASGTTAGRTLTVYGKNTPYSSSSELYNDSKGTELGSFAKPTSTNAPDQTMTLNVSGDYEYVGFLASAAIYILKISIEWDVTTPSGPVTPTVSFASDPFEIEVGATETNTIAKPSDLTVTYSTDDKTVATVNASTGEVTGVAEGTATITASWDAVANKYNAGSASYTVNVIPEKQAVVFEKVTNANQLVAGNEYILVATENSVAMGAQDNTNYRSPTSVTISNDEISIKDEPVAVLTLGGVSGAWTFFAADNTKYLGLTSDGNNLNSVDNVETESNHATWVITDDFQLKNTGYTEDRFVRYNSANPRFASYKSGQATAVLFMKQGGAISNKEEAGLVFTPNEIEVEAGQTATVTLAKTTNATVSFSNSNSEVATYDAENGIVTALKAGTTTIIATSPENEGYLAGEATLTVTVTAPAVSEVKVTEGNPYEESFATNFGSFATDNTTIWTHATYNNDAYAKATSYIGGSNTDGDAWLISPIIDLTEVAQADLEFNQAINKYFGTVADEAMLCIKEVDGEWVKQDISYPELGNKTFSSFELQTLNISAFAGKKIVVGFHYIGSSSNAGTWEVNSFKVSGSSTIQLKDAELAFTPATITVEENATATVEFTKSTTADVTFTNEDPTIATYDAATGVVSALKAGTTTITASSAANEEYNAGTATLTITVSEKTDFVEVVKGCGIYQKITSASDLEAGKRYLIVYETQDNDLNDVADVYNGVSNKIGQYVEMPLNSDMVDNTNGTATHPIVLQSAGSNKWYLMDGDNFLYWLSGNNLYTSDEVSQNGNTWSINFGEGGMSINNVSTPERYLQFNSSSPRFACYTGTQKNVVLYKELMEVVTVNISAAGLATFCSDKALDFTNSTTVYAYKAVISGSQVNLTKVAKVPAQTGVLLRSVSGGAVKAYIPVTTGVEAFNDNAFVAVMTEIASLATETTEDGVTYVNYILNKVNGVTDFYKANGKKVGANKAYLRVEANKAKDGLTIGYADETDGIRTIGNEPQKVDGIYNLSGQRVNKAQKGIYIVNGKKVVVK